MKVLVATEKPFAKVAVDGIRKEIEAAGFELALLEKYTDKAQLLDAVKDANAIIIRSDIIDAEVFEAAKELKIVVRAGAGYDNVDLAAATAHNVCVMNTPGQNSNAVAELALGMMVYAVRNFYNGTSGTELMGKKHIPATAETKNSINYALLKDMPKGAMLVNTARKEVINEAELIKLMEDRADFKYITDIMPAANAEFAEKFAGRYFSTPKKMGAQTAEANINAGIAAAQQIVGFLKDGCEKFRVNK